MPVMSVGSARTSFHHPSCCASASSALRKPSFRMPRLKLISYLPPFAIAAPRDVVKISGETLAFECVDGHQPVRLNCVREPLEIENAGVTRGMDDLYGNAACREIRLQSGAGTILQISVP